MGITSSEAIASKNQGHYHFMVIRLIHTFRHVTAK